MKKLLLLSALLIFAFGFGQTPITDANFSQAIETCLSTNPIDGMCSDSEYGAMPDWDVSQVTDMSYAFGWGSFNGNVSQWDVSSVTNMRGMFDNNAQFNGDISEWDVSSVTNMSVMFQDSQFNGDVSQWDVSSVTNMSATFNFSQFNGDISSWDVSNVTNMAYMFDSSQLSTSNYDAILNSWSQQSLQQGVPFGASNVKFCDAGIAKQSIIDNYGWIISDSGINFEAGCSTPLTDATFQDAVNTCLSTNPIDGMCSDSEYGAMPDWDVSQVTDMSNAFKQRSDFNADISAWDVSSVTNMRSMFDYATSFNQPIGDWHVSNVTNMRYMFYDAFSFNQPIGDWNVSSVTNMGYMFAYANAFNQDISNWCVTNITSEPTDFSTYAPLTESNKPVWGTCPSLGIDDLNQLDISIYPNPVKNMLTIDGLVVKDVVIYSLLGKAILKTSNQNTIDVSSLSKGVYFIKVSDGINASTKKFIKD